MACFEVEGERFTSYKKLNLLGVQQVGIIFVVLRRLSGKRSRTFLSLDIQRF